MPLSDEKFVRRAEYAARAATGFNLPLEFDRVFGQSHLFDPSARIHGIPINRQLTLIP
jgi:hypothetical protein